MQEEHPIFEIEKLQGNTLVLKKKNGTWNYDLRPEEAAAHLRPEKRGHLEQAQKEGETIGLAEMDRVGERGLKLREIRL